MSKSQTNETVIDLDAKRIRVAFLIILISLAVFLFEGAAPEPFILGLPWHFWAMMGVTTVMFALLYYLIGLMTPPGDFEYGPNGGEFDG